MPRASAFIPILLSVDHSKEDCYVIPDCYVMIPDVRFKLTLFFPERDDGALLRCLRSCGVEGDSYSAHGHTSTTPARLPPGACSKHDCPPPHIEAPKMAARPAHVPVQTPPSHPTRLPEQHSQSLLHASAEPLEARRQQ